MVRNNFFRQNIFSFLLYMYVLYRNNRYVSPVVCSALSTWQHSKISQNAQSNHSTACHNKRVHVCTFKVKQNVTLKVLIPSLSFILATKTPPLFQVKIKFLQLLLDCTSGKNQLPLPNLFFK